MNGKITHEIHHFLYKLQLEKKGIGKRLGGAVMIIKLPFKLDDYAGTGYEKEFITWILREIVRKPKLRKFSLNIQSAWQKLLLLDNPEFEIIVDSIVRKEPIYPNFGSTVFLDLIRLVLFKADCSFKAIRTQYKLDSCTPRRIVFDEMRVQLELIDDQSNGGLGGYVINLILAIWVFKQKQGPRNFNTLWEFSLEEYWDVLKERCPELFDKPKLIQSKEINRKEIQMKTSGRRKKLKKEKVAI